MTLPVIQCSFCTHFYRQRKDGAFCDAFSGDTEIPGSIIEGEHDHRKPYPGDSGIRFEPVDEDAASVVAEMFGEDNA